MTTMATRRTTTKRKGRYPEISAEEKLAAERFDAIAQASIDAERREAVYQGELRGRFINTDPEAARLDAERETAMERGDEPAADKADIAFEKRFRKFRDKDKGFAEIRRQTKAAVRAYNAAVRAEEGDDEEMDGE